MLVFLCNFCSICICPFKDRSSFIDLSVHFLFYKVYWYLDIIVLIPKIDDLQYRSRFFFSLCLTPEQNTVQNTKQKVLGGGLQSTNFSVDVFGKGNHSRCQVTATARFLPRNPFALKTKLQELNPFLDDDGMVQVGGRLQNSLLPYDAKHPVILGKSHVAWLLIS